VRGGWQPRSNRPYAPTGDIANDRVKAETDVRLGLLYVLSVPYVAGFACFGGPTIGGYRATGWVFVVMLVIAPLVYIFERSPGRFPLRYWIPWVAMVIVSLSWVEHVGRWQVQDMFQIVTPFVIAPIASKAIRGEREVAALLRGFSHCLLILLAATGLFFLAGANVLVRPMSLTAALIGSVFVAQIRNRPAWAIACWSGCLFITAVTGGRIATLALLLQWCVLPGARRLWPRVVAFVSIVILAIGLFYTPVFQQRFFGDYGGSLSDLRRGDFSTSGRGEAWPELIREVKRRPLLGAGVGMAGKFTHQIWEEETKPHNDYLRILLEQGILGLLCFLAGAAIQIMSLWRGLVAGRDGRSILRVSAILGFFTLLVVAYTDNPIVYGVWFMHPLMVLAGASYPSGAAPTAHPIPSSHQREDRSRLRLTGQTHVA
jgi:hypothetical protein